jgi:hypothetical protein
MQAICASRFVDLDLNRTAQHTPSGRRSLSRACRPFMGLTLKGRNGSI